MKCNCRSHNGFLTKLGFSELAQRRFDPSAIAGMDESEYVDKVGSVSGLELERDLYADSSDQLLLEQCERFHNGS